MMTNPAGRLAQGQFSFRPDPSDDEITAQVEYGLRRGYAWSVEYTDDPHPRHTCREMLGLPSFGPKDLAGVMLQWAACRKTFPNHDIRMMAFDNKRGVETIAMNLIVNRPARAAGFGRVRQEAAGRNLRCTVHSHRTDQPEPERYSR